MNIKLIFLQRNLSNMLIYLKNAQRLYDITTGGFIQMRLK